MSSVGSSDSGGGNRSDEIVRRNREDYQKSESTLVKNHQKEMRRINEKHYAEVERLKSDHQTQMDQLRKLSNDAISARDHRYQKEMEEVRGMHKRQMENSADETQRREETLRKTIGNDKDQARANNDARFEKLKTDYGNALQKQTEDFQQALKEGREEQARSIATVRSKQEAHHNREMDAVRNERNESVGSLQKQYQDYRENAEGRLKSQEIRHMQSNQRSSSNLVRAVQKERELRNESEGILRDGFEDGLGTMRDRYEKAMEKERAAGRISQDHLKNSTIDRVDNQVRRLEMEKEDLKEAKIRNELQMKHQQQREINNMRKAFSNNVENLQMQRDEAVRMANEKNRDDVVTVHKELGDQLVSSNRFYRERMAEQNRINRDAYDNIKGDFDARNEQSKMNADMRVMRIHEESNEAKARLIEQQKANHEAGQRQQQAQIKATRSQVEDEKNIAVRNVHDQMRKQELAHSERMALTVSKYEKQIQTLKDQMLRERKLGEDNLKRTVEEMQRAHQVAIDQLDSKNKDQMRTAQARHQDQVKSLNRRHEEKIDSLLTEVKKTT